MQPTWQFKQGSTDVKIKLQISISSYFFRW